MDTSEVQRTKLAKSMSCCSVGSHGFCNLWGGRESSWTLLEIFL